MASSSVWKAVGICTGGPARTSLRSWLSRPRPRAEISPPATASQKGGSFSTSAAFHPFFSTFSAAFSSRRLRGQPRDVGVGWVISSFIFFFLLTFSFAAAQSPHSTLLADGHGRLFPSRAHQAPPPTATTAMRHDDADMPPRHRMRYVAVPLAAAPTASLCPRHRASCAGLPSAYVFFFLFLLPSSFAVQSLRSHHQPCRRMRGRPPPPGPTTVQSPTVTTMPPHARDRGAREERK